MNKLLIILLSILFLINITFADTNGIWIDAKDVVSGTFGSDEGNGNFSFPNNLGIGKTNPTSKLDVMGVTTTDGLIVEKNEGAINLTGTDHVYMQFYPQGTTTRKGWIGFGTSGTEKLSVQSENDALSLNPYGNNVGIGTLNPSSKLDVVGDIRGNNIYSNGNLLATQNYVNANDDVGITSETDPVWNSEKSNYATKTYVNSNTVLPSGTWCGIHKPAEYPGDSTTKISCKGQAVRSGCPSGFTSRNILNFQTCIKN